MGIEVGGRLLGVIQAICAYIRLSALAQESDKPGPSHGSRLIPSCSQTVNRLDVCVWVFVRVQSFWSWRGSGSRTRSKIRVATPGTVHVTYRITWYFVQSFDKREGQMGRDPRSVTVREAHICKRPVGMSERRKQMVTLPSTNPVIELFPFVAERCFG